MNIVLFFHSLLSDWNHGNAHFLRGIVAELLARGHRVQIFEPADGWSAENLAREHGQAALERFASAHPDLAATVTRYSPESLDLEQVLADADLVLVHEWNAHDLVAKVGANHAQHGGYVLLFHDTHHRLVTAPTEMHAYDLSGYDGVLAYGEVLSERYRARGLQAWTWHEAADTRLFRPLPDVEQTGDLVWIGNWGDGERTRELHEFLLRPIRELDLNARIYGVRYPDEAVAALKAAGATYGGYLPNDRAPEVFAQYRATVHVPRGPYTQALPGIPTIRVFEALACGTPLVSAPWHDVEGLFRLGVDFLVAPDGDAMIGHLRDLMHDGALRHSLIAHGLETINARHTCAHRADELFAIYQTLTGEKPEQPQPQPLAVQREMAQVS